MLKHKTKLLSGILMIISILIFLSSVLFIEETKTKTVPCYDKYNNKIDGLTCKDIGGEHTYNYTGDILSIVGMSCIFLFGAIRHIDRFSSDHSYEKSNFFGFL